MPFTEIIPVFIEQLQPPALPVTQVKTEPLTVVKNEPPEPEIGIDDILDSSNEEIILDIKNIDAVSHIIHEDSIKSETGPKNIIESKHSEFVGTQFFVKTEDAPFVKIENIIRSENLSKSDDTSDENGKKVVDIQGSNEDFNALNKLESKEELDWNPETTDFPEYYRTCETISWEEDEEKIQVVKAPVVPVEPHEYTTLAKDKHICNHCQYSFSRLKQLKRHIQKIHREVTTMYQCPNCPLKSKWRSSLQNHIIRKHKDTNDIQWFKCNLCEKKFKLNCQLAKHTLVHLTREQMQDRLTFCPVCGKGFSTKSKTKRHVTFVHNKTPQKRIKCEEARDVNFEQKYECSECDYKTKHKNMLERHKRIHERRYHCDRCHYETYKRENFNKHKLIHLKPEEMQYFYCYHCSYKSNRKDKLKTHIFRHIKNSEVRFKTEMDDRDLKYHCDECDYKTDRRHNFHVHKIIHLSPEKIQYFYCYHCSFKSKRKDKLKTHILRHFKNGEVKFHCYICDFMALEQESITEHIKEHSKVQIKPEIKEEN